MARKATARCACLEYLKLYYFFSVVNAVATAVTDVASADTAVATAFAFFAFLAFFALIAFAVVVVSSGAAVTVDASGAAAFSFAANNIVEASASAITIATNFFILLPPEFFCISIAQFPVFFYFAFKHPAFFTA
jgi:hypothetical protein